MTNIYALAAMIDDDVITVKCKFPGSVTGYTYKCKQDLAKQLIKDDWVLVSKLDKHSSEGFDYIPKLVQVHVIDEELDVDVNSQIKYEWIFQKVDLAELAKLQADEKEMVAILKAKQRKQLRESALKALGIDDTKQIKKL